MGDKLENLGGNIGSSSAAVSLSTIRLEISALGPNLDLWWKEWKPHVYSDWYAMGGAWLNTPPTAVSWAKDGCDIFQVSASDHALYNRYREGDGDTRQLGSFENLGVIVQADPLQSPEAQG